MSKTFKQLQDYVKAGVGEYNDKTYPLLLLKDDINRSYQKVQRDLRPLAIKSFTKEAISSGAIFAVPSDLSNDPNAIIDVLASNAGTRGSVSASYTDPTANLTFTAKEPGTTGIVIYANGVLAEPTAGTVNIDAIYTTFWTLYYTVKSDDLTCNQILALLNAHPIFGNLVTVSTSTPSVKPKPSEGQVLNVSAGTGANWYPADEWSIGKYNRLQGDSFRAGTTYEPKWCLKGDSSGSRMMYMYPNTITYTKLHYYYVVADLSSDSDVCAIPQEFEELLLIDSLRRAFGRLGDAQRKELAEKNYMERIKAEFDKYGIELQNTKADNERIKSND
jgi:NAD(P)-dependent dehydrogenase (short-subunit alcohol dehydrogenase family)